MLSVGKSYRVRDADLIRHGEPWARLDGQTDVANRTLKLIAQPSGLVQKEFVLQDVLFKRLSLQKTIPVVLFEPNHLQLLTGSPETRRDYLDTLLEQIVPGFSALRRQYKRALSQRNSLLKQQLVKDDQIFVWNIRLGQLGGQIVAERIRIVQELQSRLEGLYEALAGTKAQVEIRYISKCALEQYSSDLMHKLEHSVQQDMERGFTSYGPHREDFGVWLGGFPTAEVASRGETRTLLLALKIMEVELLERHRDVRPILLLDDVFSELDGARRRALTEVLQTHQTFITTTDADVVVKHFTRNTHIIPLGNR